jgi:hypothetical protein
VRATAAIPISTFTKKIRRQDRPRFVTSWTACCRPVPTVARTRS